MMWPLRGIAFMAAAALSLSSLVAAGNEELCAIAPGTYAAAKSSNPEMAFAIAELEKHAVATWYSDRLDNGDYGATARQIVATCPASSRMSIVVYGLPNKDCEAKESMVGTRNQNSAMYQSFVSELQQTVGDRKVLYIVEPDAIALLAKGGCAKSYGYGDNLAIAVRTLSQNPNADIYLDVGHWMLTGGADLSSVASIVRGLASVGRVKGITINTSNYRATSELSQLCANFRGATSGLNLHCIVDTSRNYNGASSQDEWCNYKNAAVGRVPTGNTGDENIDYFVWIKPPGESDGTCAGRTSDAMSGPGAGKFFPAFMKQMWNNGALVKELGMPIIDGSIRQVAQSSTPAPTAAPTPSPTPSATPTPTPTPVASETPSPSDITQQSNSTTEDRSLDNFDLPSNNSSTDSSAASASATGAGESTDAGAAVEAAPVEQQPVFSNSPDAVVSTPSGSSAGAAEASTRSSAGGSVSAGIVVLGCLIGVAVVALGVVVGVRVRQRSIEETKTPMEPRVNYLSNTNTPGSLAQL